MRIKAIFLAVFFIIYALIQINVNIPLSIRILFILNFCVLFFFTLVYMFQHKDYSPFIASYIVFNYLFFILAPTLQLDAFFEKNRLQLFTGLTYKSSLIYRTSTLILFFNSVFFLTYFMLIKKTKPIIQKPISFKMPFYILCFFALSILVFVWKFNYLMTSIVKSGLNLESTKMSLILNNKFFSILTLIPFILSVDYVKRNWRFRKKNVYIILLISAISLIIVLLFKNPFTERRNAVGVVYLSLVFLIFPKILNTNFKILMLMFFALIIVFPLTSILTHNTKNIDEISYTEAFSPKEVSEIISTQFESVNFDAYLMFASSIDYVDKEGLEYGKQLTPAFLFFVPRNLWQDKPISSGELMGQHIQNYHDHNKWFHNLATPYIAESYLNFGIFGVFLFAIVLAIIIIKFTEWLKTNDPLKQFAAFFFAIHLIFFLRGDFVNGYVYYFLPFIAFFVFPKMVMKVFK